MLTPSELDRLRVVLVATRNPLNIGAVARAMSNFGLSRLRVVNPYDPAFREARSAIGASELLASAEEYKSVGDAVADCKLVVGTSAVGQRELRHSLKRLGPGARLMRKQLGSGRVAILFGSEKVGLANADLSHCHWLLHIPTCEKNISMNLGQAVAVCLYELVRDAKAMRQSAKVKLATAGEVERIISILLDVLHGSGYVRRNSAGPMEEKVRRLVRRFNLSARDAEVLLGMVRQIAWKVRQEKKGDG